MNEQTYLDTVCNRRKCNAPHKPKPQNCCEEYMEYTCQTNCGKVRVRKDRCGMDVQLEIKDKPHNSNCPKR